jgi:diadenylate cyclase
VFEWVGRIFTGRSSSDVLRDVVDVAIVAYLIYRALLVVRGTRAMQMGAGLMVILLLYVGAKAVGLITLQTLLSYVLSSIILIVVVVFQNDIRRALIRVGGQAWFGRRRKLEQSRVIDEVVVAVTELARHRIGALIAFEQDASLLEFTKSEGVIIGGAVTRELLVSLFYPESLNKLHDGAVIIRDLKIARAGVFFPMPDARHLDSSLGSRHRAALGITEETDAVVVVVSEERGTISYCYNGNLIPNIDGTVLRQTLVGLLQEDTKKPTDEPSTASAPKLVRTKPERPDRTASDDGRSGGPRSDPPMRETVHPTTTPLPRPQRKSSRVEQARMEAARSTLTEAPRSRISALPMPKAGNRHDREDVLTSDDGSADVDALPAGVPIDTSAPSSQRQEEDS